MLLKSKSGEMVDSISLSVSRIKNLYYFYLNFKWKIQVDLGSFGEMRIDLSELKW